jgi:DNA adenine methylase
MRTDSESVSKPGRRPPNTVAMTRRVAFSRMDDLLASSPKPKPFLKWAGGKRKLLSEILPQLGSIRGAYFEPFLGAGAVLLGLDPRIPKFGNDINGELINTWLCIQRDPEGLLFELQKLDHSKEAFLEIRALDRKTGWLRTATPHQRAARTIYLNKTCFNGLYRVNSKGHFNVPFADYKNPRIVDEGNLRSVSTFLNTADERGGNPLFQCSDYEAFVEQAKSGDVVYFDPPYAPISKTASFVGYASGGFGEFKQLQLRDTAAKLINRGVRVLISNSDSELINDLYSSEYGFQKKRLSVARPIAAKPTSRGAVGELLILGLPQ